MFLLVHSPLTSRQTWARTAEALRQRGEQAVAPDLTAVWEGEGPYLAAFVATAAEKSGGDDAVDIALHSGAGVLAWSLAARLAGRLRTIVFVDAILPDPGRSWFDTAPPALADRLRGLSRDGRLPPWHEWFEADAFNALLPNPHDRAEFTADAPRPVTAYFEEMQPFVAAFERCAYLKLSATYESEYRRAGADGWRTRSLNAHHLAMVTSPQIIAKAVCHLAHA